MKHVALILAAVWLAGCADDVLPATSHLRRPVDLALVCLQGETGAPLPDCTNGGSYVAMIVNAERGSLARLDVSNGLFYDDDQFIPGFSPTPLGRTSTEPTRPVAITALPDGSASFIAQLATSNLVRVDTSLLQTLGPGSRRGALSFQELPGRPADVVLRYPGGAPDGVDQELLVAMPEQGVVARVPVEQFGEATSLDAVGLPGGSPYDLVVDGAGDVLYVGHADVGYVSVVDLNAGAEVDRIPLADPCFDDLDNNDDGLIDSADWGCRFDPDGGEQAEPTDAPTFPSIALPEGGDLPDCANGVDDDGDGLADFPHDPDCLGPTSALEAPAPLPVLARMDLSPDGTLIYAVNARTRTVEALDTTTGTRIDINAECAPGANALFRRLGREGLSVPGVPTDVVFAERPEADGGELVAYVSNTGGGVTVIEVEAQLGDEVVRVHRVLDSELEETQSRIPFPTLFTDAGAVDLALNRRPDFPSFGESVAEDVQFVPVPPYELEQPDPCPYPAEQPLRTDEETLTDWGIAPAPNERLAISETWDITHQGYFLDRTARLGAFVNFEEGIFATPEQIFCSAGVEVGDTLVLRTPRGLPCDIDAHAVAFDVTEVTQHRLTVDPASGRVWRDAEGVLVERELADPVPLTEECFPEPLGYRVRVPEGTYVVVGSVSGYLHPWQAAPDGSCEIDPDADPRFVGRLQEWTLEPGAELSDCPPTNAQADEVFEGEWFHNHAFTLRMIPGCTEQLTEAGDAVRSVAETAPEVRWRFTVDSAFGVYGVGGMGTPRSLKWLPPQNVVYAVDAGQEKIVAIPTAELSIEELIGAVRTFR